MKVLVFVIDAGGLNPEHAQKKLKKVEPAIKGWMEEHGLDKEYIPLITLEPIEISVVEI